VEKYGFVYIWFDRKHKRYYIGAHWGTEYDGYVCSSSWMKKAYSRRPQDFKRRILERVYSNRKQTFIAEEKYLDLIKKEEFGKRYYNLKNIKGHWSITEEKIKSISQRISEAHKNNPDFGVWNRGLKRSEEVRKKISESTSKSMKLHYEKNPRTQETKKLISKNSSRLQKEKKIGMHGKKHSDETINKMKVNNAMNNPEYVAKVKKSKQGIRWLINGEVRKMAIPGTDKYNNLIKQGFNTI
jgi:hypothetical protein